MPHTKLAHLPRTDSILRVDDEPDSLVVGRHCVLVQALNPSSQSASLKRGNLAADTCAVEGNAAEHLFDSADGEAQVADEAGSRERPDLAGPSPDDPLKLYVRQIGDGRLLTPLEEREL